MRREIQRQKNNGWEIDRNIKTKESGEGNGWVVSLHELSLSITKVGKDFFPNYVQNLCQMAYGLIATRPLIHNFRSSFAFMELMSKAFAAPDKFQLPVNWEDFSCGFSVCKSLEERLHFAASS